MPGRRTVRSGDGLVPPCPFGHNVDQARRSRAVSRLLKSGSPRSERTGISVRGQTDELHGHRGAVHRRTTKPVIARTWPAARTGSAMIVMVSKRMARPGGLEPPTF